MFDDLLMLERRQKTIKFLVLGSVFIEKRTDWTFNYPSFQRLVLLA